MAMDLTAVLRLQDDLTKPLRQITRQMSVFSDATRSLSRTVGGMGSAIGQQAKEMSGLKSQLAGVAGAYMGAQGAIKAFNATIGAAAQYEASEVAVKAIFNDDEASSAYMKMVDSMALASPLLNSTEMLSASKGLVAMTKDVDELGKAWSIVERLQVLDPTQGTDGAAFALKEMWQGDSLSMVERFGLDKKALNEIKKMNISEQVTAISALLDGMGVTQATVDAMGQTTLGYWSQIGERTQTFMRTIGNMGNSKIGEVLGGIVTTLDSIDLDSLAIKIDAAIGEGIQNVIDFGKRVWELREPILSVAKVFGTFALAVGGIVLVAKTVMGIGAAIAFFASPIGILATAITAATFGFKALYDNSEKFRGIVDGIKSKVSGLFEAFKADGIKGVIDAMIPKDAVTKMTEIFNKVKDAVSPVIEFVVTGFTVLKEYAGLAVDYLKEKFAEMQPALATLSEIFAQVWGTVSDVFSDAWSIISPILGGLWDMLQIVGDVAVIVFNNVIVPALGFLADAFSAAWSIVSPILELLAVSFEIVMAAVKALWENVLKPFIEFVSTIVADALNAFSDGLSLVSDGFDWLSGKVTGVYDKIRDFADMIRNVKLPDWVTNGVNASVTFVQDTLGVGKAVPGHYHGLDNVPYDGYTARLHRGETVLNAQEAKQYREGASNGGGSGGGVTIAKLADQIIVREDADIDRIAEQLVSKILAKRVSFG